MALYDDSSLKLSDFERRACVVWIDFIQPSVKHVPPLLQIHGQSCLAILNLVSKLEEAPKAKLRLSRYSEERILTSSRSLGFDYVASATIIILETGMRPLEFLEMKKDQVSLSGGWLKAISYKTGRRRIATAQPRERIIPITDRARAELEKLLAQSRDEYVFPYRCIKKAWATVCRTAGVKGFWFRWLRDEAENRWREAGMHPLDIAYLMGHASPRTTMIYNNPHFEEMLGQMSAANRSKIVAIAPSKAWERRIRTRVDETFQWNLVGESPTWAKP